MYIETSLAVKSILLIKFCKNVALYCELWLDKETITNVFKVYWFGVLSLDPGRLEPIVKYVDMPSSCIYIYILYILTPAPSPLQVTLFVGIVWRVESVYTIKLLCKLLLKIVTWCTRLLVENINYQLISTNYYGCHTN